MNDRFRFRAWNIIVNRYEYFDFYSLAKMDYDKIQWHILKFEQCTGLKDKNGRLIYEGDIAKRIPKHDEDEPTVLLQVEWNNKGGRYVTTDKKHSTWTFSMFDYFYEVVGNIHENPELLKECK